MSAVADKIQSAVTKSNRRNTEYDLKVFLMLIANLAYTGMSGLKLYEFMEKYVEEFFDYED